MDNIEWYTFPMKLENNNIAFMLVFALIGGLVGGMFGGMIGSAVSQHKSAHFMMRGEKGNSFFYKTMGGDVMLHPTEGTGVKTIRFMATSTVE